MILGIRYSENDVKHFGEEMYYLTKHNLFVQEVVAKVNIWNGGGLMGRCWMASMAPGTRYTCCFSFCGH